MKMTKIEELVSVLNRTSEHAEERPLRDSAHFLSTHSELIVEAAWQARHELRELFTAEEKLNVSHEEMLREEGPLRDAFAMAALTGILSGGTVFARELRLFGSETLAEYAYKCADAMLAERGQRLK